MKLLFASGNENKVNEIRSLLSKDWELLSLKELDFHDDIPETADTIEGNALMKAQFCFDKFNVNCFADDTGLEVDALNGEPGVYSARYAGEARNSEDNIQLLLENLKGIENRNAQFKTVISVIIEGKNHAFTGIVKGEIRHEKSGNEGFGYDAIFEPEKCGRTFAEMTLTEKNQLSHRARAFKKLIDFLKTIEK